MPKKFRVSTRNRHIPHIFQYLLIGAYFLFSFTTAAQDTHSNNQSILAYHNRALKYIHQNELDSALKALNQASKVAQKNEDIKGLIDTYHKFAFLHLELDDLPSALFYRDRGSISLKDMQYPYGEATRDYLEARIQFIEDKPYQALELLTKAKKLSNDKNLRNNIMLTEADIYTLIDRFKDAEKNYNALLVNSDEHERAYLAAKANIGLAQMNLKRDDLEKSSNYAESALKISQNHGYNLLILKTSKFLTDIYEQMGQYNKSLQYLRTSTAINDSIFTIEKEKEIVTTAEKITNEQKDGRIAELEEQNEKLLESENRAEITAILTSAFLTIISFLAVSLYRNNQIKLRTNDLLQTKNSELEKARDEAIHAMKAKSNFLSTVTHELRTPLYAVTGLTHILLEENPSAHQKEHLKSLKFSGDYLLNFINDILQINKIDADKVEILNSEFKLKKVLTDVLDSLQQNANEQGTKLILNYDNTIPLNLLGDPLKLSQVFMNLVGNALKFTKDGEVEVTAKILEKQEENAKIYFEVKDSGIGISEEKQKTIFESFEQGSVQINRQFGGTGLGLTIVKSLLGLFNSDIQLESIVGEGSKFFFELNFKCEESILADVPFELNAEEFDFTGQHLLIVEDNKINQVITKKMLVKKEMTCDMANNGFEAVDAAKSKHYDCILMDIHMPGMGGTEATMEIRKFNKEVPIIALTAISMEDSVEEFIAAGCNDVVTKPFKPELFYQKIGENIFNAKAEKEA